MDRNSVGTGAAALGGSGASVSEVVAALLIFVMLAVALGALRRS